MKNRQWLPQRLFMSLASLMFVAVICIMAKATWEEMHLFGLLVLTVAGHWGKKGQELKQGGTLAPHGLLRLPSYTTQDRLPRDSTTGSELGPRTWISNKENMWPHTCIGQPGGSESLAEVLPSLVTLVCAKLTEMNQHSRMLCSPLC